VAACGAHAALEGPDVAPLHATAACPRDATIDATGRCACVDGTVAVLGACVTPAAGDAFCGPAARIGANGCEFRPCGPGERLDLGSGRCAPSVRPDANAAPCAPGSAVLFANGHRACASADAACPRGTRRSGGVCVREPRCPPGSLAAPAERDACRAVVLAAQGGPTRRRVDVGSWTALAIGADGGRGSRDLCRPLEQQPELFEAPEDGGAPAVQIRVHLSFPDQDLSRLSADIEGRDAQGRPLQGSARRSVDAAVGSLVELLRGLGGEASAASVDVDVRCAGASGSGPRERGEREREGGTENDGGRSGRTGTSGDGR
jgi:hypothetical protein